MASEGGLSVLKWAAAGFLLGVLLGVPVPVPVALAACALLLAVSWRLRRHRRHALPICLAFLMLGSARASHPVAGLGTLRQYNGHHVQLEGVVAEEPDIRDTGANYVIRVTELTVGRGSRPVTGAVQVHTSRAVVLDYGDLISLDGTLRTPRNDSTVPYRTVLARRGIGSTMRFPRMLDRGPGSSGPGDWIVPLRQALERGIDAWLPEPEAALLIAVAIGSRSAALGNVTQPLIATGLIHIIAISGIKVAMVAGTAYLFLRRLPGRLTTLIAALLLLAVYVALTGATVSGERSAIMWGLVFVAAYLGRGTLSWYSLGMVAAVMAALRPDLVWDPAFQMTVLGTGSIIAFSDRLLAVFRVLPPPFREAFCVTLAAQAGTLPVVVLNFHVLSVWGPLANAFVLPMLPLLIVLGFTLGAVAALPPIAVAVADFAYVLLHAVLSIASVLAALPGAVPVNGLAGPITAIYYGVLAAVSVVVLRRVNWAPRGRPPGTVPEVVYGVTVGAVLLSSTLLPAHASGTRLQWLGSGEALLLQSDGRTVLINGSPRPFQLLTALSAQLGMQRRLDAVIVTDPRSDVGGLLDVLNHYAVGEVVDVGCEYPSLTYARWRAALRSGHIPVYALRTGAGLTVGSARVTAIGPDAVYPQPRDSIGLLRVTFPGRRVLLAGAASQREMLEAVFRPVQLRADVLVLDAGTTPPRAFLRHVSPVRVLRPAATSRRSESPFTIVSTR